MRQAWLAWLGLAACGGGTTREQPASAPIANATGAPGVQAPCAGDSCMLARTFVDIRGNEHGPGTFSGRVVVVGFFATWAEGRHNQAPLLSELASRYPGVQFLAIAVEETSAKVAAWSQRAGIRIPVVMSTEEILTAFEHPMAVPLTFVFDKHGRLAHRLMGLGEQDTLTAKLDKLILGP